VSSIIVKYAVWGLLFFLTSCTDNNITPVKMEQVIIDTSNVVINCNGEWYNDGKPTNLIIRSRNTKNGWVQTQNVTIKNCKIRGAIRVIGLGQNGEAAGVKASSLTLGHSERAQAIAPRYITFSNVIIEGIATISRYLAPGASYVIVEKCQFTGTRTSVALYLDAESSYNIIRNNQFETTTAREAIDVDGSAHNLIEGNNFEFTKKGGIYLYRNCGEGGTIRHQTPS
jgi:parallel beta-helix repeat protein